MTINAHQSMMWASASRHAPRRQAFNGLQLANLVEVPANENATTTPMQNAILSMNLDTQSGWISARVYKADSFSPDNPMMLVTGTDVDGTTFRKFVNINDVNPRNASLVEMIALEGYLVSSGKRASGLARASVLAVEGASGDGARLTAFTTFDFVTALESLLDSKRLNGELFGKWDEYMWLRPIVDALMSHISRG
ncbi:MAG: hypothetical protein FWD96_05680 [Defluviitaleaceae bacterium]|nr:hypothetical protein [Defluviitaleaceae bacterium]